MQICSTGVFVFLFVFTFMLFFCPTSASQHCAGLKGQEVTHFTFCPLITPFTVAQPPGLVCQRVMHVVHWQDGGKIRGSRFIF